ncbi:hypothetical protein QWZ03_04035 [Chitinimonas viridis]|uniref:Uncharacterized protein n=1 Tax=Chitinimonas viridis TaxID=664880 RepID=A0ABT8B2R5_9NEIS|nr:hypothetical protein [Chitinimonas viridis]MDN3575941.1 hypothetical protein [Chitinimonas viridis]
MQNKANPKTRPPRKQRGNALLIFFLLVAMGMLSLLVSKLGSQPGLLQQNQVDQDSMNEARQALVGAILSAPRADARLPADLIVNDDTFVTARLNYARYALKPANETGNALWYAASGYSLLDTDSTHWLSLCDAAQPAANDIAIAILSPSEPLTTQTGRAPSAPAAQYLEGVTGTPIGCTANPSNADNNRILVRSASSVTFNDQLLVISRKELLSMHAGLAYREIATRLANYAQSNGDAYPDNATFSAAINTPPLPTWLLDDTSTPGEWIDALTYNQVATQQATLQIPGCAPITLAWDSTTSTNILTPPGNPQCP